MSLSPVPLVEPLSVVLPRYLDDRQKAFEKGERFALFEAILWCGIYQAVIPQWAVEALIAIKTDVDRGLVVDAESWGKKMGPPGRPVGRAKASIIREQSGAVLLVLARLRTEGHALDNAGFDVAKERILKDLGLNLSRQDIEAIYKRSGKGWLKGIPQGEMPTDGIGISHGVIPYSELMFSGRPLLAAQEIQAPQK